jgi:hypothetical protein
MADQITLNAREPVDHEERHLKLEPEDKITAMPTTSLQLAKVTDFLFHNIGKE